MRVVLGKTLVPYTWLLNAAFAFALIVIGMLLFIFFFLWQNQKRRQKKSELRELYSDLIAGCIVCEAPEEVTDTLQQFVAANNSLLAKPFARNVLIREIVKTMDSISGKASENLRLLFEKLELDNETFARFQSKKWHCKASAIQRMAEMQQSKYLVNIYRETNNRNDLIRTEAQIAVVKLTGFKGLRFLNIVRYPISQWQQLSLISQLQEGELEEDKIKAWLRLENDSVVEFALRLVEVYKCYDLHDAVVACLQHPSPAVRLQALQALKEVANDTTADALLHHFPGAARQEQLNILDMLGETGAGNAEISFLTSLLQHPDEAICFHAVQAIQQINPAWPSVVTGHIKDHPSFTYILSLLPKKAV